jgi:polyhydroxyalkanoate synthase
MNSRTSHAIPELPSVEDASRIALATLGRLTGGLSPQALGGAWINVLSRIATAPGKQAELARDFFRKSLALTQFAGQAALGQHPAPASDGSPYAGRFSGDEWSRFPYNLYAQGFLAVSDWARDAVRDVPGAEPSASNLVSFMVREGLEAFAPDNYLPTNPKLVEQTLKEHGRNLVRGMRHLAEDVQRTFNGKAPPGLEQFKVGKHVAVTPGKVILRNRLMELIQYSPQTKQVHAEPVLIVPAWIMKYYILDLSPGNSLVNYLTGRGHTVFMVSWKNPAVDDRELSMDDYLSLGVLAAVDAIGAVVPKRRINAVGYCIGGTLLSIAAAYLAGRDDDRLMTITLFAAQTDFSEPGELSVFISPAQLAMLEAMMWKEGVLDSRMMGSAFQMLRTYDLLWSPAVGTYVRGERAGLNDLMAWNADGTRMAYRMHSDYLHRLYLQNDLAEGRYVALGDEIDLANITVPMFVVGTETDHVAPWRSVYKAGKLVRSTDYTFCLTSGGHNAGIISGPQHPRRRHRVRTTKAGTRFLSADRFLETVEPRQGSWWPTWGEWLAAHSSAGKVAPPKMGAARKGFKPLEDAPGTYVLQK